MARKRNLCPSIVGSVLNFLFRSVCLNIVDPSLLVLSSPYHTVVLLKLISILASWAAIALKMSELPRKRLAVEMDVQQEPPNLIKAQALRNVNAILRVSRSGKVIYFEAQVIDCLAQLYRDDMAEVAEEFFEALQSNAIITDVVMHIFLFDRSGFIYERLGRAFGTLSKFRRLRMEL